MYLALQIGQWEFSKFSPQQHIVAISVSSITCLLTFHCDVITNEYIIKLTFITL